MKIDRLVGILTVLLRQGSATAPELAARFEVSRRTISRDVEDLCRAGIPLVTTQGYGGGISVAEGYRLRPDLLTREELETLLAGLGGIGSVSRPGQLAGLLDKLPPGGPPGDSPVAIDLASHYQDSLTHKIGLIRDAIRQKRLLTFRYYYEKGECRRTVEPYRLLYRWQDWYLWGWCLLRQDFRLFKLARLWEAETGGAFPGRELPPGEPDPDRCFCGAAFRLKAVFAPGAAYRLVEEYGPGCWTETERGLLLERDFSGWRNMAEWVLSFGDQAEVLEPPALREELRRQAENLAAKYGGT